MAIKQFYHDIDLVNVGQLVGARLQNVSSSAMATLAEQLGAGNKGLTVYNTTDNRIYVYNGAGFDPFQIDVAGDIKFRGVINAGNAANVEKVSGYQYVVDAAGTLSASGVTFFPNAEVEVGDQVLFASATEAYVLQRNDVQATETTLGNVSLASQAEANAGTNDTDAITPKTLHGYVNPEFAADRMRLGEIEAKNTEQDDRLDGIDALNAEQDLRLDGVEAKNTEQDGRIDALEAEVDALQAEQILSFFGTVNLAAATPFTVSHGLNLMNKDSFVLRTALGGSDISLDVDSVNVNSLTLTSLVPLNNVTVYVVGR
jgi:hypothetical protein